MLKKLKFAAVALLLPLIAFAQSYPSPTFQNLTVLGNSALVNATITGTFTATGAIGLPSLAPQAANTVVGNATSSNATPTAITVAGCNGAAQALQWTNGSGFQCNSSIATSGSNANITSLSGLTTPLSVAQGGTGAAALTQYNVLVGTGTTAISSVGPSTAGFVLTSNGPSAYPSFQNAIAGRLIGVQKFTSSGTYTPTPGTNSVIVEVQAAGGGSGGAVATSSGQVSASPGGGAGAYAKARFTTGFSGVTVTIGAAGSAGTAGGAGGNASATSFGSLISCPGGIGSGAGANSGGTGGLTAGAAPTAAPTISGGTTLFSVAGSGTPVSMALSGSQYLLIAGANSVLGIGGSVQFSSITQAAVSGSGFGSGPSGAANAASQSASVGAAGQPGIVIVYEYN